MLLQYTQCFEIPLTYQVHLKVGDEPLGKMTRRERMTLNEFVSIKKICHTNSSEMTTVDFNESVLDLIGVILRSLFLNQYKYIFISFANERDIYKIKPFHFISLL